MDNNDSKALMELRGKITALLHDVEKRETDSKIDALNKSVRPTKTPNDYDVGLSDGAVIAYKNFQYDLKQLLNPTGETKCQ